MPLRRAASRERSPLDSRVCRESRGRALLLADPALGFRSHGAGLLHGWVWHRVASGLHHPHGAMKDIHAAGIADVTRALGPRRDLNESSRGSGLAMPFAAMTKSWAHVRLLFPHRVRTCFA